MTGSPGDLTVPPHPLVLEINTWPWLSALSDPTGRRVDLASVSRRGLGRDRRAGYDAVWLMGVWQRSPAGVAIAMTNPDLWRTASRPRCRTTTDDDVVGSPYCIRDYVVDDRARRAGRAWPRPERSCGRAASA